VLSPICPEEGNSEGRRLSSDISEDGIGIALPQALILADCTVRAYSGGEGRDNYKMGGKRGFHMPEDADY